MIRKLNFEEEKDGLTGLDRSIW